ncbi:MAG: DUF4838 domain-containing protein [Terrimicrobiaceae bacterium]
MVLMTAFFLGTCPAQAAGGGEPDQGSTMGMQGKVVLGRGLLLAEDGRAVMSIVLSPQASDSTKGVADELAGYLQRITGARFAVTNGDGHAGILLGTLAEFPNPKLGGGLQIRNGFDGREAYAIRTEGERLLLVGATDLGVSHAAFRLLEALGCRWFFPSPAWEVVPSIPKLRVEINETDRPAILARRIWYGYGYFKEPGDRTLDAGRCYKDYAAWSRRNRMNSSFTVNTGHAWQNITTNNKAIFDQHPEYFALVEGKRGGRQLCVSNPVVRQLAVEYALAFLKNNPAADMVSMECSDGAGQCECGECRKLGSISDRVFGLANEVARAVAKEQPGKQVGVLAYYEHSTPPSFPLEPNIYVQLTSGWNNGPYTFDELMKLWGQRCRNLGFYDYYSVWNWDWDMLPGGRANNMDFVRRVSLYAAQGASSYSCESGNNWGVHGRGYYVANRLMWNPRADVVAILDDFYSKAFGPAAPAMQRYYERFEWRDAGEPLMGEPLLALGFRDVDEATRLAQGLPEVQARLDEIKQYLRYVQLRWQLDIEKDKGRQKDLTLAILTHVYRSRYAYMNHWVAMRQEWTARAAKEFEEPTWAGDDASPNKPWAVEKPYTREETEAVFQEGLAGFKPQAVEEKRFSDDLVAVNFADSPFVSTLRKYRTDDVYHGGVPRYALFSRKGEALSFQVSCGEIASLRDKPQGHYKVTNREGRILVEGRLPLDGKSINHEVKVGAPGLYYLQVEDNKTGCWIQAEMDRSMAICMERGRGFVHAGSMRHEAYFYVPLGTREIQYYWRGSPHQVYGPDGKLVQTVVTSGTIVRIPVPDGADGNLWFFGQFVLRHLWFFNVPNYLAASPDALLVPREVVKKDGLNTQF